jgi:hypothetical protein
LPVGVIVGGSVLLHDPATPTLPKNHHPRKPRGLMKPIPKRTLILKTSFEEEMGKTRTDENLHNRTMITNTRWEESAWSSGIYHVDPRTHLVSAYVFS